jgi:hypothetical protein
MEAAKSFSRMVYPVCFDEWLLSDRFFPVWRFGFMQTKTLNRPTILWHLGLFPDNPFRYFRSRAENVTSHSKSFSSHPSFKIPKPLQSLAKSPI